MRPPFFRSLRPFVFTALSAAFFLVRSAGVSADAPAPAAPPVAPAATATAPAAPRESGPLTTEQMLAQATVPPEFDVNVFATPDQVNYPVSVAAAPDGTLYVASDANSSLGVDLGRGRVVRLRDTDGDGRADELRQFAKMDSPRGLVWDGDRLYVMHPPHLSVFIDRDGDGVSDEQRILVKNIAFSFRDRPADHTSNGVTLGVDGWLYLAIGDFGFMEAEGTDGRKMQLRGGGVVRVRPDGSGLELYSSGTRNILEVALSPRLDGIARDNTNDGGAWDVRLHHFTGLEEHGYPKLFRNFTSEIIAPLADYGGGAGCGALWLDEPGIPAQWNAAPFTSDWGRGQFYRHGLTPNGATFTATQEPFVKLARSTDLDVDAQSHLYLASWYGGQYTYGGPNVGFILRLSPKNFTPAVVPDFEKASGAALVELLNSPSYRTRLAAERALLRRGVATERAALEALASAPSRSLDSRIAALFTLKLAFGEASHPLLLRLAADPSIAAWAIRALGDHPGQASGVPDSVLETGLKSSDPRTRKEALIASARLGRTGNAVAMTGLLADSDPIVAHTAIQAMVRLKASDAALAVIDKTDGSDQQRTGALRVVQALHEERVVQELINRLAREKVPARREGLVTALCRLYYVEGKWTGDSWGTRPDTRGPYYQPERWAGSAAINTVLKELIDHAEGAEAAKLTEIFALHRLTPGDSIGRLLALAQTDNTLLASLAEQLSGADNVPAAAIPLLERALTWTPPAPPPPPPPAGGAAPAVAGRGGRGNTPPPPDISPTQIAAVQALVKLGTPEAIAVVLKQLPALRNSGRLGQGAQDRAANALFQSSVLDNYSAFFAAEARKLSGDTSAWADAALLQIAARKFGAPEVRDYAVRELDEGWKDPARRAQIVRAAGLARETSRATALVAALDDSDPTVAAAAKTAVATLKLDVEAIRAESAHQSPTIATLAIGDVLAAVVGQRGTLARGEQIFSQAGCIACHTVNPASPLKGPFLGNITRIYPRRELAEAILDPNKSIAQGFATYQFTMKNGSSSAGFVTRESAEVVSVRDLTGQQQELRIADIAKRDRLPISLMPPGLMSSFSVRDLASLLDYLESLAGAP